MHKDKRDIGMKRAVIILAAIFLTLPLMSQTAEKKENFFKRTAGWISRNFIDQDTMYVSPEEYNLFIMPRYTFKSERYHLNSPEEKQSITLRSNPNNTIGLHFGWRCFSIGYSADLSNSAPDIDIDLEMYTSGIGLDLFLHKHADGFRIKEIEGFDSSPATLHDSDFKGFSVTQGGAKLFYVFNYKKFSFPAVYSHTRIQRISAGSFIIGATYQQKILDFDHTQLHNDLQKSIHDTFKFDELRYLNISINACYSYNWVFAKDFVANISLTPSVGYKGTDNNTRFSQNINFDLQARAAVVYNNGRYFAGTSFLAHTFFYNNESLKIEQENCTVKVYVGFNFLRRKNR